MKYSADDIAGQRFEAKMRGYDRAQVEEFLQQVAVEWTRLAEENRRKSKRIEVLGREVRDFRKREKSLVDALETARTMAREITEQAEREADLVVGEAELKAERLLAKAEWRLGELRKDFIDLQQSRIRFEAELRALLDGHGKLLDRFDSSPDEEVDAVEPEDREEPSVLVQHAELDAVSVTMPPSEEAPIEETSPTLTGLALGAAKP